MPLRWSTSRRRFTRSTRSRRAATRSAPRSSLLGNTGRRGLSKFVRRLVNRGVEVKHVGQNVVNAAFNSIISSASECYPILPQVGEGTDGHQRIGDRIRPKYLIVKGKLQYDRSVDGAGGAAGTYLPPSTVRVMILTQKNIKVSSKVSTDVDVDHLLKDNIGTDIARPYGSVSPTYVPDFDNLAPINKDLFTVHMDRKFRMKGMLHNQLGNSQTITLDGTQNTIIFTKKIRCPKTLYFDDGNADYANNFAPFVCMGAVVDNSQGAWLTTTPYRLTIQGELYFTDA